MTDTLIPKPHSPALRTFFFWSGIVATVLYRAIIILNHVHGPWSLIAWYVGTIGFVLYFAHRYQVTEIRSKLIAERQLQTKIESSNLSAEDRQALKYVLGTLRSSKERWNYIAIFVTSAIAILIGIYLDFLQ